MSRVSINTDKCKKDGSCALVCPEAIFVQKEKATTPEIFHEEECIACGQCVSICPQGAVVHADFPSDRVRSINQELIPSGEQVLELLKTRRSVRALRDRPVERDLIEKIIDAARFAPSARNSQSTEYIVVQDKAVLRKILELTTLHQARVIQRVSNPLPAFARLIRAFENGQDQILHNAPVLVLFHADRRNEFAEVNAALALQNAALICHGFGLGSFFAGYVTAVCQQDDSIPRLLTIPENHVIYGALAIGYPKLKFKNLMERDPAKTIWI
jgi:nitroreductase/NAD-dependent dihydropyrimidine dehydrogenase PreA subunit